MRATSAVETSSHAVSPEEIAFMGADLGAGQVSAAFPASAHSRLRARAPLCYLLP
jgi:hypothetical protein